MNALSAHEKMHKQSSAVDDWKSRQDSYERFAATGSSKSSYHGKEARVKRLQGDVEGKGDLRGIRGRGGV